MSRDKVSDLIVEALKAALSQPGDKRLYRSGKLEGLFPSRSGLNGEAATQAVREGMLEITRTETRGKTSCEWVRLTPRGVDFLHEHESPVRALQELSQVLKLNQDAVPRWLGELQQQWLATGERLFEQVHRWQEQLQALTVRVEEALRRVEEAIPRVPEDLTSSYPWTAPALDYLERRKTADAPPACPLPELFEALQAQHPELSLTGFHDGLRRLQDRRLVRLLPAATPEDLAQPEYALFDGGQLLYAVRRGA